MRCGIVRVVRNYMGKSFGVSVHLIEFLIDGRLLRTWNERGFFSDMFGVVFWFYSGLAFAGVVFTIFLQLQAFSLLRQEQQSTVYDLPAI
jgi:hypothetical protein